jgi:hypothetical protein
MVVTGPRMMETTLVTLIGKEAGTIIIRGIITITMTTRQVLGTMVATSTNAMQIMLIMLMLLHHL